MPKPKNLRVEGRKKAHSLSYTKWLCSTTLSSHLSIDEKSSIINIEVVWEKYSYKGVEIIEGHLMPDHVHMLVSIPPRLSVSSFMGYLKGKSALMMFDKHANLSINLEIVISGYRASTIWGIVEECKLDLMKSQLRNIYKNKEIIQWMISS